MKSTIRTVAVLAILAAFATPALAQLDLPRVSPKATVSQTVGLTDISITYCRPGVKGRVIWGGLVPYDQVWRTGANEATTITFSDPVTVNGTAVAAGTYGLFTIPGLKEWTVILNKGATQWGSYEYKQADDLLRFQVTPRPAAAATEWMELHFESLSKDSAEVVLAWEKLEVAFTVKVDVINKALVSCRAAVAAAKADDWRTPYRAFMFCLDNNVNLDEAQKWLNTSLQIKQTYANLLAKARFAALTNHPGAAVEMAKEAIAVARKADPKADVTDAEKLLAEWQKQDGIR